MLNDVPSVSPLRDGYWLSALDWQRGLIDSMIAFQRDQSQILATWEKSLGAVYQDLWDQWVCRFGGGVPLDG